MKIHIYLLIDPRNKIVIYVGQSGKDPLINFRSRYKRDCRHNKWLSHIIKKLKEENLEVESKIDSWHETKESANKREQELIAYYRIESQGKLTNVLDGGREGWQSNEEWLRLHNDGMRKVSKYIKDLDSLITIANLFLSHTTKQETLAVVGCTEQYLNQLLRGELHKDLWQEIPDLLNSVLIHAEKYKISLGGKGGANGTPREDRPDDLVYQIFSLYEQGISVHKIREKLGIGLNISEILKGIQRPNLLKRWLAEGNKVPDLTRYYEYQISDETLYNAFDLKKDGLTHSDIAEIIGCSSSFISIVFRGKKRSNVKEKWEQKNGKMAKNNMQKRLDDSFGFTIFELFHKDNLPIPEIAKRLGVTRQYVHKILKGLNKPHIKLKWEESLHISQ